MTQTALREPMEVKVAFNSRFVDPLLSGRKIYTTRYHCLGQVGDFFKAFGGTFIIDRVNRTYLYRIAEFSFWQEGFRSTEDFITFWNKIYPERHYHPNAIVYLHRFFRET